MARGAQMSLVPPESLTFMNADDDVISCIIRAVVRRDRTLNAYYALLLTSHATYLSLRRLCLQGDLRKVVDAEGADVDRWVRMANDALLATYNSDGRVEPGQPYGRNWMAQVSRHAAGIPYTNLQALTHASVMVLEGCEMPRPRPETEVAWSEHETYFLDGLPAEFYSTFGKVCPDMPKLRALRVSENEEATGGLEPFFRGLYYRVTSQPGIWSNLQEMHWTGDGLALHEPSLRRPRPRNEATRTSGAEADDAGPVYAWIQDLSELLESRSFPHLQLLHLTDCGITDAGFAVLGPALWTQRNLLSLGLRCNRLLTAQGLEPWIRGSAGAVRPEEMHPPGLQLLRRLDLVGTGADASTLMCLVEEGSNFPSLYAISHWLDYDTLMAMPKADYRQYARECRARFEARVDRAALITKLVDSSLDDLGGGVRRILVDGDSGTLQQYNEDEGSDLSTAEVRAAYLIMQLKTYVEGGIYERDPALKTAGGTKPLPLVAVHTPEALARYRATCGQYFDETVTKEERQRHRQYVEEQRGEGIDMALDDDAVGLLHALNLARLTDYRANLTESKYATAADVISFLEPYVSELVLNPVECLAAVLDWHQVREWCDQNLQCPQRPLRHVSTTTLCAKYDIHIFDFITMWRLLGVLGSADPRAPYGRLEEMDVYLCVGKDIRTRTGPAMCMPVPVPSWHTFRRQDLESPMQRFGHQYYHQTASVRAHAHEHAPNEQDPDAHENTIYAYGLYLGTARVGCLGIPQGTPPTTFNLDPHRPGDTPSRLRRAPTNPHYNIGYPEFIRAIDIEGSCPMTETMIRTAQSARHWADLRGKVPLDLSGRRVTVRVGPGCAVRVRLPVSTEEEVATSAEAHLYGRGQYLVITSLQYRGFLIILDLDDADRFDEHQVLTADRLGGIIGSFDPELTIHDAVYASQRVQGVIEYRSVIFDDTVNNNGFDGERTKWFDDFFVQVDTRRLRPDPCLTTRIPEAIADADRQQCELGDGDEGDLVAAWRRDVGRAPPEPEPTGWCNFNPKTHLLTCAYGANWYHHPADQRKYTFERIPALPHRAIREGKYGELPTAPNRRWPDPREVANAARTEATPLQRSPFGDSERKRYLASQPDALRRADWTADGQRGEVRMFVSTKGLPVSDGRPSGQFWVKMPLCEHRSKAAVLCTQQVCGTAGICQCFRGTIDIKPADKCRLCSRSNHSVRYMNRAHRCHLNTLDRLNSWIMDSTEQQASPDVPSGHAHSSASSSKMRSTLPRSAEPDPKRYRPTTDGAASSSSQLHGLDVITTAPPPPPPSPPTSPPASPARFPSTPLTTPPSMLSSLPPSLPPSPPSLRPPATPSGPPPTKTTLSLIPEVAWRISHRAWNRLMHALHGNTTATSRVAGDAEIRYDEQTLTEAGLYRRTSWSDPQDGGCPPPTSATRVDDSDGGTASPPPSPPTAAGRPSLRAGSRDVNTPTTIRPTTMRRSPSTTTSNEPVHHEGGIHSASGTRLAPTMWEACCPAELLDSVVVYCAALATGGGLSRGIPGVGSVGCSNERAGVYPAAFSYPSPPPSPPGSSASSDDGHGTRDEVWLPASSEPENDLLHTASYSSAGGVVEMDVVAPEDTTSRSSAKVTIAPKPATSTAKRRTSSKARFYPRHNKTPELSSKSGGDKDQKDLEEPQTTKVTPLGDPLKTYRPTTEMLAEFSSETTKAIHTLLQSVMVVMTPSSDDSEVPFFVTGKSQVQSLVQNMHGRITNNEVTEEERRTFVRMVSCLPDFTRIIAVDPRYEGEPSFRGIELVLAEEKRFKSVCLRVQMEGDPSIGFNVSAAPHSNALASALRRKDGDKQAEKDAARCLTKEIGDQVKFSKKEKGLRMKRYVESGATCSVAACGRRLTGELQVCFGETQAKEVTDDLVREFQRLHGPLAGWMIGERHRDKEFLDRIDASLLEPGVLVFKCTECRERDATTYGQSQQKAKEAQQGEEEDRELGAIDSRVTDMVKTILDTPNPTTTTNRISDKDELTAGAAKAATTERPQRKKKPTPKVADQRAEAPRVAPTASPPSSPPSSPPPSPPSSPPPSPPSSPPPSPPSSPPPSPPSSPPPSPPSSPPPSPPSSPPPSPPSSPPTSPPPSPPQSPIPTESNWRRSEGDYFSSGNPPDPREIQSHWTHDVSSSTPEHGSRRGRGVETPGHPPQAHQRHPVLGVVTDAPPERSRQERPRDPTPTWQELLRGPMPTTRVDRSKSWGEKWEAQRESRLGWSKATFRWPNEGISALRERLGKLYFEYNGTPASEIHYVPPHLNEFNERMVQCLLNDTSDPIQGGMEAALYDNLVGIATINVERGRQSRDFLRPDEIVEGVSTLIKPLMRVLEGIKPPRSAPRMKDILSTLSQSEFGPVRVNSSAPAFSPPRMTTSTAKSTTSKDRRRSRRHETFQILVKSRIPGLVRTVAPMIRRLTTVDELKTQLVKMLAVPFAQQMLLFRERLIEGSLRLNFLEPQSTIYLEKAPVQWKERIEENCSRPSQPSRPTPAGDDPGSSSRSQGQGRIPSQGKNHPRTVATGDGSAINISPLVDQENIIRARLRYSRNNWPTICRDKKGARCFQCLKALDVWNEHVTLIDLSTIVCPRCGVDAVVGASQVKSEAELHAWRAAACLEYADSKVGRLLPVPTGQRLFPLRRSFKAEYPAQAPRVPFDRYERPNRQSQGSAEGELLIPKAWRHVKPRQEGELLIHCVGRLQDMFLTAFGHNWRTKGQSYESMLDQLYLDHRLSQYARALSKGIAAALENDPLSTERGKWLKIMFTRVEFYQYERYWHRRSPRVLPPPTPLRSVLGWWKLLPLCQDPPPREGGWSFTPPRWSYSPDRRSVVREEYKDDTPEHGLKPRAVDAINKMNGGGKGVIPARPANRRRDQGPPPSSPPPSPPSSPPPSPPPSPPQSPPASPPPSPPASPPSSPPPSPPSSPPVNARYELSPLTLPLPPSQWMPSPTLMTPKPVRPSLEYPSPATSLVSSGGSKGPEDGDEEVEPPGVLFVDQWSLVPSELTPHESMNCRGRVYRPAEPPKWEECEFGPVTEVREAEGSLQAEGVEIRLGNASWIYTGWRAKVGVLGAVFYSRGMPLYLFAMPLGSSKRTAPTGTPGGTPPPDPPPSPPGECTDEEDEEDDELMEMMAEQVASAQAYDVLLADEASVEDGGLSRPAPHLLGLPETEASKGCNGPTTVGRKRPSPYPHAIPTPRTLHELAKCHDSRGRPAALEEIVRNKPFGPRRETLSTPHPLRQGNWFRYQLDSHSQEISLTYLKIAFELVDRPDEGSLAPVAQLEQLSELCGVGRGLSAADQAAMTMTIEAHAAPMRFSSWLQALEFYERRGLQRKNAIQWVQFLEPLRSGAVFTYDLEDDSKQDRLPYWVLREREDGHMMYGMTDSWGRHMQRVLMSSAPGALPKPRMDLRSGVYLDGDGVTWSCEPCLPFSGSAATSSHMPRWQPDLEGCHATAIPPVLAMCAKCEAFSPYSHSACAECGTTLDQARTVTAAQWQVSEESHWREGGFDSTDDNFAGPYLPEDPAAELSRTAGSRRDESMITDYPPSGPPSMPPSPPESEDEDEEQGKSDGPESTVHQEQTEGHTAEEAGGAADRPRPSESDPEVRAADRSDESTHVAEVEEEAGRPSLSQEMVGDIVPDPPPAAKESPPVRSPVAVGSQLQALVTAETTRQAIVTWRVWAQKEKFLKEASLPRRLGHIGKEAIAPTQPLGSRLISSSPARLSVPAREEDTLVPSLRRTGIGNDGHPAVAVVSTTDDPPYQPFDTPRQLRRDMDRLEAGQWQHQKLLARNEKLTQQLKEVSEQMALLQASQNQRPQEPSYVEPQEISSLKPQEEAEPLSETRWAWHEPRPHPPQEAKPVRSSAPASVRGGPGVVRPTPAAPEWDQDQNWPGFALVPARGSGPASPAPDDDGQSQRSQPSHAAHNQHAPWHDSMPYGPPQTSSQPQTFYEARPTPANPTAAPLPFPRVPNTAGSSSRWPHPELGGPRGYMDDSAIMVLFEQERRETIEALRGSKQTSWIGQVLEAETDNTGMQMRTRSFWVAEVLRAWYVRAFDPRNRNNIDSINKLRFPEALRSDRSDDVAQGWQQFRPGFIAALRDCFRQGCQWEQVLQKLLGHLHEGSGRRSPRILSATQEALQDTAFLNDNMERGGGYALLGADIFVFRLDISFVIKRGEASLHRMEWQRAKFRKQGEDMQALRNRLGDLYHKYSGVSANEVHLTDHHLETFNERMVECLRNDPTDARRGDVDADLYAERVEIATAQVQRRRAGREILSPDEIIEEATPLREARMRFGGVDSKDSASKPRDPDRGGQRTGRAPKSRTTSEPHQQESRNRRLPVEQMVANVNPYEETTPSVAAVTPGPFPGRGRQPPPQDQRPPRSNVGPSQPGPSAWGNRTPSAYSQEPPPTRYDGQKVDMTEEQRTLKWGRDFPHPAGSKGHPYNKEWTTPAWCNTHINLSKMIYLANKSRDLRLAFARFMPQDKTMNAPIIEPPEPMQSSQPADRQPQKWSLTSCAFCAFRPQSHPSLPKWGLGTGRGDHQPSTCRAAKRWLAEGGDPETSHVTKELQSCLYILNRPPPPSQPPGGNRFPNQ